MRILLAGINGKMGKAIYEYIAPKHIITGFDINNHKDVRTISKIEDINTSDYDLLIDFTQMDISKQLLNLFVDAKIPIISGTTGIDKEFLNGIKAKASRNKTIFYHSVNFAYGFQLFKNAIYSLKDENLLTEIIESHNVTKLDIPSGSAKLLADILKKDYNQVHALRNHEPCPMHTVIFSNQDEKIILMHQILNKDAFVKGFMEIFNKVEGEINAK